MNILYILLLAQSPLNDITDGLRCHRACEKMPIMPFFPTVKH